MVCVYFVILVICVSLTRSLNETEELSQGESDDFTEGMVPVTIEEYPYLGVIKSRSIDHTSPSTFFAVAILISESLLLTPALPYARYQELLGDFNKAFEITTRFGIQKPSEQLQACKVQEQPSCKSDRQMVNITVPKEWRLISNNIESHDNVMGYDMGLVSVNKPYEFSDQIKPANLTKEHWGSADEIADNFQFCKVVGFFNGYTDLYSLATSIRPLRECRSKFRGCLAADQICTASFFPLSGICPAPIGSALICNLKPIVLGVLIEDDPTNSCHRPKHHYFRFTRIDMHLDWLLRKSDQEGVNITLQGYFVDREKEEAKERKMTNLFLINALVLILFAGLVVFLWRWNKKNDHSHKVISTGHCVCSQPANPKSAKKSKPK